MALDAETVAGMPRDGAGLAAAAGALAGPQTVEHGAPQADLFAEEQTEIADGRAFDVVVKRERGRPAGSTNRTNEDWRQYMLRNHRSPLLFLAELYTTPTLDLYKWLRTHDEEVTLKGVLDLQERAAAGLAPYLHRKQPQAIDAGEGKPIPIIQQIVVGADGIAHMFARNHEETDTYDVMPRLIEGEVADEKSQSEGANDASR